MPRDKLLQKWKMLLKYLVDLNVTSLQSCDKTLSELKSFVDNDLPKLYLEFEKCSLKKINWINLFLIPLKYLSIAMFLLSLLLTLSQAQASVEEALVTTRAFLKPT